MKIDKAIATLAFLVKEKDDTISANENDAVKLGIEALKAVKYLRTIDYRVQAKRLPGETET